MSGSGLRSLPRGTSRLLRIGTAPEILAGRTDSRIGSSRLGAGDQPIDWGKLRVEWTQQLEERLGDSVRDLPNATEAHVGSGLPGAALAELAKEHDAQLITVGAHAGGRLSRFLLGSTAERVLVDAPVPVLVVPPAGEADA